MKLVAVNEVTEMKKKKRSHSMIVCIIINILYINNKQCTACISSISIYYYVIDIGPVPVVMVILL